MSWNLDPFLIVAIAVAFTFLFRNAANRFEQVMALLALLVAVLAFVSPLCALTTALFSARGFHHIISASLLAPLIVLASRGSRNAISQLCRLPPEAAFLASTATFWAWHMPFAYSYALSGTLAYWLMQAALMVSSIALWVQLLSKQSGYLTKISLSVGTMVQMGFLSALLTFAPYPLFDEHLTTTAAYGISALADQQLAGLIMWTIGLLPYLYLTISALHDLLRQVTAVEE
jgi:putative membrane protein